eukprot:TRINITY_DN4831_c0_g1_i1.p1 TRINITY_DN4831_c0_g1~~TRINITY_DN4831_c0_g1_i1.p1  ORF type:complete len:197 (-),score=25.08 TRINITY_DN4831_c0_g1_i1:71-661(-)
MFVGTLIEFYRISSNGAPYDSFCVTKDGRMDDRLRLWYYIYYLSKYYEFIDSILKALSGKPLGFLHVYHHFTIVWITFLWARSNITFCAQGVLFNTFVHVIMYYYFFLTSLGVRGIWWKKYITLLQIVQFVCSLLLAGMFVYYHLNSGGTLGWESESGCSGWRVFLVSTLFNASLLFLFVDFFKKSYSTAERRKED